MSEQRTEMVCAAKEPGESRRTFEFLGGCVYFFWRHIVTHVQTEKSFLQCHMPTVPQFQ